MSLLVFMYALFDTLWYSLYGSCGCFTKKQKLNMKLAVVNVCSSRAYCFRIGLWMNDFDKMPDFETLQMNLPAVFHSKARCIKSA